MFAEGAGALAFRFRSGDRYVLGRFKSGTAALIMDREADSWFARCGIFCLGGCPIDIAPFDRTAGVAILASSWRERVVGVTQNDILSATIRKNPKAAA